MLEQILEAIRQAEAGGLFQWPPRDSLTGFSGEKLMGALQRLTSTMCEGPGYCYLEIGVFQGLIPEAETADS